MRVLSSELPAHAGERVTMAGWLHAKRELGAVTFVILRDRAGLAQIVAEPPVELSPETVLEVDGVAVAAEQAPGGVELQEPSFRVLSEPAETAADGAAAAGAEGVLADAPRPCAAGVAPSGRAREAGDHGCVGGGFPACPGRARLHRDLDAEDRRLGYRERRERLPRSTTSAGRRTWRRARSSTSRRWWASSSASTRPGRSGAPSRTRRGATSPSTPRSTPSSASSATTST